MKTEHNYLPKNTETAAEMRARAATQFVQGVWWQRCLTAQAGHLTEFEEYMEGAASVSMGENAVWRKQHLQMLPPCSLCTDRVPARADR